MTTCENTITITDAIVKTVENAIKAAIKYERLTGKKLGITGEVGEILICSKLKTHGLRLMRSQRSPGYDAIDRYGKKFSLKPVEVNREIRSRHRWPS